MSVQMESVQDESEDDFFYNVYVSSRMREVASWGWGEIEAQQFLKMQYEWQKSAYLAKYPNLEFRIIYFEGEKAGRLLLGKLENKLIIVDITILPIFQGNGVGTKIISEIQKEADNVQLSVKQSNERAIKLYKKLGFYETSRDDLMIRMECKN